MKYRMKNRQRKLPIRRTGTAQADAWWSGVTESWLILEANGADGRRNDPAHRPGAKHPNNAMNTPKPPEQSTAAPGSVKPPGSATCAVDEYHSPAVCELAIDGEWFPVCREHAINRMLPRRPLSSPNDPDHRPGGKQPETL